MTVKKGYNRFFIIFQEEDKGFGIAIDKQPTGYTKIESRNGKCKITVYVQNLVKERGPYVCCLLDTTKNPVVCAKMGEIGIDETGRGETWWEYREEDIAETGISADRFNTAAVLVDDESVMAPLAGYVGKDRQSWKDRLQINTMRTVKKEEQPVEEEEKPADDESQKFNEYEEKLRDMDKSEQEEEKKEDVPLDGSDQKRSDVQIKEDGNEPEKIEAENMESIESEDKEKVNETADRHEELDVHQELDENQGFDRSQVSEDDDEAETDEYEDRHNKKKTHADIFLSILKNYQEMGELSPCPGYKWYQNDMEHSYAERPSEFRECRWWKIPFEDDIKLENKERNPYYCAIHHLRMIYPYIDYIKYIKKQGYCYFGIKFDKAGEIKYLMYGVEGSNNSMDQPYMGLTGFAKWVPLEGTGRGIWLMYYNPYNGCIMIPKRESDFDKD